MMTFAEKQDSKEIKPRYLNGYLRLSVWAILFLVAMGSVLGLLYWRRTQRADESVKRGRETAVDLIVKAIKISDSLALERHREVMDELQKTHPAGHEENEAKPLDTAKLYEQLQPKEEK